MSAPNEITQAFQDAAFTKPVFIGKFFRHPTIDQEKTARYGINVYKSDIYIRIKTKGRKDTTARVATETDKEIFTEAWENFRREEEESGMPLQALPGWTVENAATLKDLGIESVESLATADRLPWHTLRVMQDAAKYFLKMLENYQPPPVEEDDHAEETVPLRDPVDAPRDRQEVRENPHVGNSGGNAPTQRFGVYLDEEGNVQKVEGGYNGIEQENHQKESLEEKESVPQIEVIPSPFEGRDPLEGLIG